MNLHVVGDSFATYDPSASHWATIWGSNNGVNVNHYGHPGRDHVFIVSDYLDNNYIDNADLVVYQVTDFLRLQVNDPPMSYSQTLDALLQHSDKYVYPTLTNMSTCSATDKNNMFTAHPGSVVNSTGSFCLSARNAYAAISHSWLVQATWLAMNNLFLECKLRNIPVIVVPDRSTCDINGEHRLFSKFDSVFTTTLNGDRALAIDNEHSVNHYGITAHRRFAELFGIFVHENNLY